MSNLVRKISTDVTIIPKTRLIDPLNIFENQSIPVGIHYLSKSFRQTFAKVRVLARALNSSHTGKTQLKGYIFSKTKPDVHEKNPKFNRKGYFISQKTKFVIPRKESQCFDSNQT